MYVLYNVKITDYTKHIYYCTHHLVYRLIKGNNDYFTQTRKDSYTVCCRHAVDVTDKTYLSIKSIMDKYDVKSI